MKTSTKNISDTNSPSSKIHTSSRRRFLQSSAVMASVNAVQYQRVFGANEKLQIGIIGCGGRGRWHIGWIHRSSQTVHAEIVAVCDIWDRNRLLGSTEVEKRFGITPKSYQHHRETLANQDIDAVLIASPDHLHCPHLMDAVQAGKDVYVEKPIATSLSVLTETYRVVKQSNQIVQNGTQGRSSKGALAAKQFIQSGQLGKILRIEESRSHYVPYWNHYSQPHDEQETDWNAFQHQLPKRSFDADRHGSWMGYNAYSPNTIGGWMSHFSDFVHFTTGCGFPVSAISHSGIYSPTSEEKRTAPDTVTAIVDYPEGFSTLFTTHFGNGANNYNLFFGTKGTMRMNEPDGNTDGIAPVVSGEGSEHPQKLGEAAALEEIAQDDHMINWLRCIQSRKQPNANMDEGYKQGVAVLLAETARTEERKVRYDRNQKMFA